MYFYKSLINVLVVKSAYIKLSDV